MLSTLQFGKKEPTEAEKRQQSMDAMFEKAKLDDDEGERIKGRVELLSSVLKPRADRDSVSITAETRSGRIER
jgi:hypothetical protein